LKILNHLIFTYCQNVTCAIGGSDNWPMSNVLENIIMHEEKRKKKKKKRENKSISGV
jgi:hypothetical protein